MVLTRYSCLVREAKTKGRTVVQFFGIVHFRSWLFYFIPSQHWLVAGHHFGCKTQAGCMSSEFCIQ